MGSSTLTLPSPHAGEESEKAKPANCEALRIGDRIEITFAEFAPGAASGFNVRVLATTVTGIVRGTLSVRRCEGSPLKPVSVLGIIISPALPTMAHGAIFFTRSVSREQEWFWGKEEPVGLLFHVIGKVEKIS